MLFKVRDLEKWQYLSGMANPARLIVVVASSCTDSGELVPASDPMQFDTPEEAVRVARYLAGNMPAYWRGAEPEIGGYGPPTILFQSGDVPDMG
jgi:hypothetical protein